MCAVSWNFDQLGPNTPEDGDAVRGNFIRESKSAAAIFIRELLQNTLDARVNDESGRKKSARVTLDFINPAVDYNKKLCEGIIPFIQSIDEDISIDLDSPKALLIEEFNTSGLLGNTEDHRATGEDERWANFWHRAAIPTKTKSLGRAGQGKVTFFMASRINSLFAVTRRIDDENDYAYGKCMFPKCPKVGGQYYHRHHLWGNVSTPQAPVAPITSPEEIQKIKTAFRLKRKDEPGVSFIIPYPDQRLTERDLIKAVIEDFYYPLFTNELSVSVGRVDITSASLKDLIPEYLTADSRPSVEYLSFMEKTTQMTPKVFISEKWLEKSEAIPEFFQENQFEVLKEKFNNGECVAVRFPVVIFPKRAEKYKGYIDVFIQNRESSLQTEDLFIRNGLSIGEERPLQKNARKCFALVRIDDVKISEFLGYAEEPSHNKWKVTEPEVCKRYNQVSDVIYSIRHAALALYNAMRGSNVGLYEDVFVDILSIPSSEGTTKRRKKKSPRLGPNVPPTSPLPTIIRQEPFFELYDINNNSGLGMRGIVDKVPKDKLPLLGKLVFAYNLLEGDGDPFANWHPFDFDLADQKQFTIRKKGIAIVSREDNIIKFIINDADFFIEISGFNVDQQIKAKGTIDDEK